MGIEQASCLSLNIGGIETEIYKKNSNENYNRYQSNEQINTSTRTNTRSDSSSQTLNNNNKIILIQKCMRLYLAKKRFKQVTELLKNIIELDNPVNLISDKKISSKLLSENKGEQLYKELILKKKIMPYEDTPYYRKNIKYYRPNKYLLSTKLIFIDKYKNNNLYKGTWTLEKIFHGFGTFYISGNKYEGFWNFGKLEGECRYFLSNNDYFIGNFVGGQAQGKGTYIHSDGTIYEGEWKNDQPYGKGKELFEDGSYFEGFYENGIKKKGTFKWNDGSYYDGEIKNNLFEGNGTFHWKEGREYKGSWKGGKMCGFGIMKNVDGSIYEGNFENGKREGYGKYIWNKNKYYEGFWKKGKQEGKGYFYYKGKGNYYVWKEGKILNNNNNINIDENNSRFAVINSRSESILSANKSNYNRVDKILSRKYNNINYNLNEITKKRTIKKFKDNSRLMAKNKLNGGSFSYIKRKINNMDKNKIFKEDIYNKTNKNKKSLRRVSQTDYSFNSKSIREYRNTYQSQTNKLNQTQDNSKRKFNIKK